MWGGSWLYLPDYQLGTGKPLCLGVLLPASACTKPSWLAASGSSPQGFVCFLLPFVPRYCDGEPTRHKGHKGDFCLSRAARFLPFGKWSQIGHVPLQCPPLCTWSLRVGLLQRNQQEEKAVLFSAESREGKY